MTARRVVIAAAAVIMTALGHVSTADAHPHVFVTVESTVLYDNGQIAGLRQRWYFDEFYTTMAIDGLDTNGDGIYDRAELAELAKVNVEGLAEMGYFTTVRAGDQTLTFAPPKDYFLDHVSIPAPPGPARALEAIAPDGNAAAAAAGAPAAAAATSKVLALEFTLPLKQPIPANTEHFEYTVADPQFWIWFDLDPVKGATLGPGAPAGCKLDVGLPTKDAAELQQLGEAFFSQGGGAQAGIGVAKSVSVTCPKQ